MPFDVTIVRNRKVHKLITVVLEALAKSGEEYNGAELSCALAQIMADLGVHVYKEEQAKQCTKSENSSSA